MLANLLPLSPPIRDQLDKAGIIRVIIAYLQFNQLISNLNGTKQKQNINNQNKNKDYEIKTNKECFEDRQLKLQWANSQHSYKNNKILEPLHQFALNLFQAMDGFIIVLNNKGYILYATLVGSPISNFLYPGDVPLLVDKMALFVDCSVLKVTNPDMSIVLRFLCSAGRKPLPNSSKGLPGVKAIHFMGTLWPDNNGRFIGFGQPMLPYGQNELNLNSTMFMFRATLSLKLIFVDNSLMELTGFSHKLLLENSFYKFVYPNDLSQVSEMHQTTLSQGHAQSKLFRLLCAKGGDFWIKCNLYLSTFNRLNIQYNKEPQMLIGICYIVSGKENNNIRKSIKYEENDGLFNYYSDKCYFENCINQQGSSKN